MPIYTKNFPELLEPGLRAVYDQEDKAWPVEWEQIFTTENSTKATEKDFSVTGFGLVVEKQEGKPISYDEMYRGWSKTYTHLEYGLGFTVTRTMYEDDQYRQIKAKPQALARSVNESLEIMGANVLNRAFNSSYTGGDSKELCATDHPLITGGTCANELSTATDLDVTSIENALIGIGNFVNERGLKYRAMPQKLIVSTSDAFLAKIILNSAQMPGTANNDINPAQNIFPGGFVVLHFLTDTDAWFITTNAPMGLTHFWRRRPEFGSDNDWETENAKYKTTMRCSNGWTEWRCIYGSPGG